MRHLVYPNLLGTKKLKKKAWGDLHHNVNISPSTRVIFEDYIKRVKEVVDAVD